MSRRTLLAFILPLPFAAAPLLALAFTGVGGGTGGELVLETSPSTVIEVQEPVAPAAARADGAHRSCDFGAYGYEGT